MATIDLSTPTPAPAGTLDGLPRRLALTLPELHLLAEKAGGAPLPFELTEPEPKQGNALEDRLGKSRSSVEDETYAAALDSLHEAADALTRRGLLVDGAADTAVVGALGLLATPSVAVDIDLNIGGVRAKAWHRQRGTAVATLATTDGIVFELAWFEAAHWPGELGRVAVLPEEQAQSGDQHTSRVPGMVDFPRELLDAGVEAVRSNRTDLLPTIIAHHGGAAIDADGQPLGDLEVASVIQSLVSETEGRLRVLVADVSTEEVQTVGVLSWVLVADGWRSLRPHRDDDVHRVEVRAVQPSDLAAELGPVLAEVTP
ncbi:hypothetical protein [Nocardioides sp. AE5]|uniref:hypothetical protein n=1 Tax=Nocardioides sp. AE5 TaxID=2962573 RepID=UPI0028814ACB|nr:hypothetical protein [Nocardioides sp. AE5]MDT0200490.1 hypothetical protein [Nocardioides sp. AE5]